MNVDDDQEFWKRTDARAQRLTDLIASGTDKKQLILALSKGVYWSDHYEKLHKDYLWKKETAIQNLMKKLVIRKYLDVPFGITIASPILTTAEAGHTMLENHAGFDVSVVIFKNGKISFRKRDGCDVDLKKIAELFDGGGHHYASGGTLKKAFNSVTNENFDEVLYYVDRKIKDYFLA